MLRALQRCSVYGYWPPDCSTSSSVFRVDLPKPIQCRITLRSYPPRESHYAPAEKLPGTDIGFINVDYDYGFWIGDTQLVPSDPGSKVLRPQLIVPQTGEVDICVECIGDASHISVDQLVACGSIVTMLMALLSGDSIRPDGPIHIFDEDGTTRKEVTPQSVRIQIEQRASVTEDRIHKIIPQVARVTVALSPEERLRIGKVIRRYFSALCETDLIDKFCDLWEACEFLPPKNDPYRGKIDERITESLSRLMNLPKPTIERELVSWIYDVRGDVVHNAMEEPDKIRMGSILLEDAVRRFLAVKLKLSLSGAGAIELYLADPVAFRQNFSPSPPEGL